MLAPVFKDLKPSPTLYINETVSRLWQAGETVYHMGFGESRFDVHPKLAKALEDNSHQKSYLPAKGLPQLCETIASYQSHKLGMPFCADQVIVAPGSKALIYALQMSLDADLFLPTPSWVSYEPQAALLSKNVFFIPASVEDNYKLHIKTLAETIAQSDNPNKLLLLNSPNNPTGQMLRDNELQELAVFCRENNILVLSDEIYGLVTHSHVEHVSIAKYYPEGTFISGGLSKHLSLGGWRFGFTTVPDNALGKAVMEAMIIVASEIWSAVAAPIQYAAIQAYTMDSDIEAYINTCAEIHGLRGRTIYHGLQQVGITVTKPEGAFYITANFDKWKASLNKLSVINSEALAKYLLDVHAIATLPGNAFGIPEQELSLRLSTSYLDFETSADSKRVLDVYAVHGAEVVSKKHSPNLHAVIDVFTRFVKQL